MAINNRRKSKELEALKSQIGFGMAFKATLGFYAAQLLVTLVVFTVIGLGIVALTYIF